MKIVFNISTMWLYWSRNEIGWVPAQDTPMLKSVYINGIVYNNVASEDHLMM